MGKPAARLGDPTVHGGTIILGNPTVLIGGAPAARLGDMHLCPMQTPAVPPIPHVGGPITLGSAGVLIGGAPAARMGDMATCVGPPDTIVMGCPTVLIGEVGSGAASGGGGGGGGAPAVKAAQVSASTATSASPDAVIQQEHWIEMNFVDKAGNPVSGIPYKFKDPDGKESEGTLRMDGTVRRDALSEGQGTVVLMSVFDAKWSKDSAKVGDKVKMEAQVDGFEDGTEAAIQIYKRDINSPDVVIDEIATKIKSGKVSGEWSYQYQDQSDEDDTDSDTMSKYSTPEYYFEVIIGSCTARSGLLAYQDSLNIELKTTKGKPAKGEQYVVYLSNGEVRKGKLDGSGKAEVKDVPPGKFNVKFPEKGHISKDKKSEEEKSSK